MLYRHSLLCVWIIVMTVAGQACADFAIHLSNAHEHPVEIWINDDPYGVLPGRTMHTVDTTKIVPHKQSNRIIVSGVRSDSSRLQVATVILAQATAESVHITFGSVIPPKVKDAPVLGEDHKSALFDFMRDRADMLQHGQSDKPISMVDRQIGTLLNGRQVVGDIVMTKIDDIEYVQNSIGMLFRRVPRGKYAVDSTGAAQSFVVSADYFVAVTELSRYEHALLYGKSCDEAHAVLPTAMITWQAAVDICARLGAMDGQQYRLPTESEWERAAFAGGTASFSPGDKHVSEVMWWGRNSGGSAQPVATKVANAFGLYDMHGNVREWCADWWSAFRKGGNDLKGPPTGTERVRRGGSYDCPFYWCAAGYRDAGDPDIAQPFQGVRVVLEASRSSSPVGSLPSQND